MQSKLTSLVGVLVVAACSGGEVEAPCGEPRIVVADDASLQDALTEAVAGTCIVLREGTYAGPVDITTANVTIVAATGEKAVIQGANGEAGIRILADDVTVIGIDVQDGDLGVLLLGSRGSLSLMEIVSARSAAVGIKCEDQDCLRPAEHVSMHDIFVRDSDAGLIVDGARAEITSGRFENMNTQSLAGGGAIYVLNGADVTLDSTTLDGNAYGLVADGANTRLGVTNCTFRNNGDGGLWAQGLSGVDAVRITDTTFETNGLVGIGAIGVTGMALSNVVVRGTTLKPVAKDVMTTVDVGDGLGLFSGAADVRVTGGSLVDNARAQSVVDAPGMGIVFDGTVMASGGTAKVVVQNANEPVMVPAAIADNVANPLFVRDERIQVPPLP